MNRKTMLARALTEARKTLVEIGEPFTDQDVADGAGDLLVEWEHEIACEREELGIEDTPCIQSADIWGTGEGQYHGVM